MPIFKADHETDTSSYRPISLLSNFNRIFGKKTMYDRMKDFMEKQSLLYSSLYSIRVLHSKINTVFLIETMIAKSNNKLETHNMKWSKYKSDQHTISSPLTSFIINLYFLFILLNFFSCKQKRRYWGLFRLFLFCKYLIVCQSAMYKCLAFPCVFLYFSYVFISQYVKKCNT